MANVHASPNKNPHHTFPRGVLILAARAREMAPAPVVLAVVARAPAPVLDRAPAREMAREVAPVVLVDLRGSILRGVCRVAFHREPLAVGLWVAVVYLSPPDLGHTQRWQG